MRRRSLQLIQVINGVPLAVDSAVADPTPAPSKLPLAARLRQAHGWLAPVVLAPLLLSAITGVSYRLLRDWGGFSRDQAHPLMVLHEGEWLKPWLGQQGETLYVLLNGLGLLWMLLTGGFMAWQRLQRLWQRRQGRGAT
jgi:hypothetical protein